MSLIDEVKVICDRLAPLGWRNLLLSVTNNALDISQPTSAQLRTALTRSLSTIDRTHPGFEDLTRQAHVPLREDGLHIVCFIMHLHLQPCIPQIAEHHRLILTIILPWLELDVIENFIYSLVAGRTGLTNTFIAVFAYQYREASRTPHLRHADMAYSRTGVARVGTAAAHYDASRRSFWVVPACRW